MNHELKNHCFLSIACSEDCYQTAEIWGECQECWLLAVLALPFGPSTHLLWATPGLSNSSDFQRDSRIDKQESQTWTALVLALFDFKELSQCHCSDTIMCTRVVYVYTNTCLTGFVNSSMYNDICIQGRCIVIYVHTHAHTTYICTHSFYKHR